MTDRNTISLKAVLFLSSFPSVMFAFVVVVIFVVVVVVAAVVVVAVVAVAVLVVQVLASVIVVTVARSSLRPCTCIVTIVELRMFGGARRRF